MTRIATHGATARLGRRLAAACTLALALVPASAAHARLGDLDAGFAGDGVAELALAQSSLRAAAVAAGGSVAAGGTAAESPSSSRSLVARLTPQGTLDPAWGSGGLALWRNANADSEVAAIALEAGGTVLAAGATAPTDLANDPRLDLSRLSASGAPAVLPMPLPTAISPTATNAAWTGVVALPDGRFVIAGWADVSGRDRFVVGRRLATGGADPTFNAPGTEQGWRVIDFGTPAEARAATVAVDATGAITLAGEANVGTTTAVIRAAVARLTPTGALDTGFSGDGLLIIDYPGGTSRFAGAILRGSGVLATGTLAGGSQGVLQLIGADGGFPAHGSSGAPGAAVWQGGGEDVASTVTGGAVVAGRAVGAALQTGWFTPSGGLDAAGGGLRSHPVTLSASAPPLGLGLGAGDALVVAGTTGAQVGFVARFAPNAPPSPVLAAPAQLAVGAPATFDAVGTTDPEGEPLRYAFDLDGDGTHEFDGGTNPLALRSFPAPGVYAVGVRATDPRGATATAQRSVVVVPAQQPVPQPILGRQGVARPLSGVVRYRLPGTRVFMRMVELTAIPNGTEIDARKGRVLLTVLRDAAGGLDGARFYAGRFRFHQAKGATPLTTLTLTGGSFKRCANGKPKGARSVLAVASRAARDPGGKPVRKLWGDGRGRFRTRGRYGAATVRGTKWLTADRCDGTLVRVVRGKVDVTDLVRPKRRVVRLTSGGKTLVEKRR